MSQRYDKKQSLSKVFDFFHYIEYQAVALSMCNYFKNLLLIIISLFAKIGGLDRNIVPCLVVRPLCAAECRGRAVRDRMCQVIESHAFPQHRRPEGISGLVRQEKKGRDRTGHAPILNFQLFSRGGSGRNNRSSCHCIFQTSRGHGNPWNGSIPPNHYHTA